jgi:hypothetical protein
VDVSRGPDGNPIRGPDGNPTCGEGLYPNVGGAEDVASMKLASFALSKAASYNGALARVRIGSGTVSDI